MRPHHLLRTTKIQLQTRGWTQNAYTSAITGRHCLMGALNAVAAVNQCRTAAAYYRAKYALTCAVLEDSHIVRCIESWNDRPGRTYAEVVRLLDRAQEICAEYPWASAGRDAPVQAPSTEPEPELCHANS